MGKWVTHEEPFTMVKPKCPSCGESMLPNPIVDLDDWGDGDRYIEIDCWECHETWIVEWV